MSIFIDTSAIFALVDSDDEFNERAGKIFKNILESDEKLITSNYIILETVFLLQKSFGLLAVNDFKKKILPLISIIWINEKIHNNCLNNMIFAQKRKISLTDYCSFYIIDDYNIDKVFTFDSHFKEKGYNLLEQ
ncbi:MAG: type II toxin-antitoxin system VapC family toxin [Actinobacteria bacterium]|nr:type II toxin-antitoxin system VapC family toxin [Actinomycetota bacterium]